MTTQAPLFPATPAVGDDLYRAEIDSGGFKVTPGLLEEVKRLHRLSLNEALILRAFNAVRSAQRRKEKP